MSKKLRIILQYIFFFALGVFLVWWSVKDLSQKDKSQIKLALQHARHWLIIPVFAILLSSHFIRGLRWRLLIEPLGHSPKKANTFFAVMIGYLVNQALPRFGEVMRCTMLSRYEKIPFEKLIGTVILERLIDALTLLLIFAITLIIQPDLYQKIIDTFFSGSNSTNTAAAEGVSGKIILLIALGICIVGFVAWMIIKKKKISDQVKLLKSIISKVLAGIDSIRHLKKKGQFIFLTIILWTLYLAGGYIGFMGMQQTQKYGIKEAFTLLSAGSVGMIVTPGGIGAYALLLQKTMELYKLDSAISLAFGWLLWIAQTTVILAGGLFAFIAMPIFNKQKKTIKT